jgi:hypothetical protein
MSLCAKYRVSVLNVTRFSGMGPAQQSKILSIPHLEDGNFHRFRITTRSSGNLYIAFPLSCIRLLWTDRDAGACILENQDLDQIEEKDRQSPECLVKIQEDGELAIYSENLMRDI